MPPAHPRPIRNPFRDPAFRAQLQRAILREHKRLTGQTPWNNNRGNVPATHNTGVRLNPEVQPQGIVPREQRVPEAPPARAETMAENQDILPDRLADMRTQFLNSFIILVVINIALNFTSSTLDSFEHCKIEKGTKSIQRNNCIAHKTMVTLGVATYTRPQYLNC